MPYIPKEHEQYDLLPLCREDGGEVFDYPSKEILELEELLGTSVNLFPYNFESYSEYYAGLDSLMEANKTNKEIVEKLVQLHNLVFEMNQKEEWSVLKYIGPTDDNLFGLTNGKNYYWPTRRSNPVYCGVVDDEEFTSYLYPTEAHLWEILLDPTGMAYRTIYEHGKGHISQAQHDQIMEEMRRQFGDD